MGHMQRREFFTFLGGVAAWPLSARADPVRSIGVLMNVDGADQRASYAASDAIPKGIGLDRGRQFAGR